MITLIVILMGLGIVLIFLGFSAPSTTVKLAAGHGGIVKKKPFITLPLVDKLVDKLNLTTRIRTNLDAAHLKMSAAEFFSVKLLIMAAFSFSTVVILGKFNAQIFGIALIFGYVGVDIWVGKKIAQRKEVIIKMLPEMVDLLGLCVEAGLDFTTAVKWLIEKIPSNPFIEELAFVSEEIKWGKARAKALKDMARRLNISEVNSFVQTLVQAERMGTPVAEAFQILSEDSRLQRFHRGERFAVKAPLKILIPLIFCILPVIGIVIGGPIMLQFGQSKIF